MFFSMANLACQQVTPMEAPWEAYKTFPRPSLPAKSDMRVWSTQFSTRHSFITGVEGLDPNLRVSYDANNPACFIHAFIADYDSTVAGSSIDTLKEKPQSEYLPAYAVKTFSGKLRLVWLFESKLGIGAEREHASAFFKTLSSKLNLQHWAPGLDIGALSPTMFFEIGEWVPLWTDSRIPVNILQLWLLDTVLKTGTYSKDSPEIPIEVVEDEVNTRFPGRWRGPFVIGARGVRFWDPNSNDPTGAAVLKDGMMAFSGEQAFLPWGQIFGRAFVDKFKADRVGAAIDKYVFDGMKYFAYFNGKWNAQNKEDVALQLKVQGLSPRKGTNDVSQVEQALYQIQTTRRVDKALPFTHHPPGIFTYDKQKILNTSEVTCLQPAAPCTRERMSFQDGPEHFAFVHTLLKSMFCDPEDEAAAGSEQLEYFLGWLKYFYENALKFKPKPGQVVVLAGPVGKGKTVLSRQIVGRLAGSYNDASDHLVMNDRWTERLASSPVWAVDDQLALTDTASVRQFSAKLKKYVANQEVRCEEKYKVAGYVPFYGRIIITCNVDPESLRILPTLDTSNKDKVNFFRTSKHLVTFPHRDSLDAVLAKELPYFARFLLDWEYPERITSGSGRFGVDSYHHPDMVDVSQQQGLTGHVLEVLVKFLEQYHEQNKDKPFYRGTNDELYNDLCQFRPTFSHRHTIHAVAICLGNLQKAKYQVSHVKSRQDGLWYWELGWNLFPKGLLEGGVANGN